ncbi:MAG: oligosaccharide flippase family protein [Deltaproteobacteria bacterium]|nr:oligosaccharide flippase family protein [Deltaproteobacteria bacterium]
MTPLKLNMIANFAGQGWSALMAFVFVPLYIRFLGIEAYGLIGFYATLQGAFQILDFGLSQTMNREMARYCVLPEKAAEARDLARTLEIGYWSIGVVIGIGLWALSPVIASHWIKPGALPLETVQQSVMIMGVVTALRWPLSFYEGGLMGLQRQVLCNSIKIGLATLSGCGAALVLWKVSSTITAFFTWQIIVSALYAVLFPLSLWRSLPPSVHRPSFKPALLRSIRRFAMGMSGISVSAIVFMQLDKVILSRLLSLEMFGFYALAGVAASAVPVMLAGPIFNALFPRFTSLAAMKEEEALRRLYHQGSQLMAVLVFPVASVLAFFSFDILLLWTGSADTARITSPIVSILVVGMALNALMTLPYALQISHGWTRIGLFITTFLIFFLVPTIYFLTTRYGVWGAALTWVVTNSTYMAIGLPLTHRRLLRGEAWPWLGRDVIPPLAAALLVVLPVWLFVSPPVHALDLLGFLLAVLLFACLASACAASHTRARLLTALRIRVPNV